MWLLVVTSITTPGLKQLCTECDLSQGIFRDFIKQKKSEFNKISEFSHNIKHRAYHSWQLVFRNPADFTPEIRQISWNLPDFTDFMNVSFCVMIKYRSFFRKTKNFEIRKIFSKISQRTLFTKNLDKLSKTGHFQRKFTVKLKFSRTFSFFGWIFSHYLAAEFSGFANWLHKISEFRDFTEMECIFGWILCKLGYRLQCSEK